MLCLGTVVSKSRRGLSWLSGSRPVFPRPGGEACRLNSPPPALHLPKEPPRGRPLRTAQGSAWPSRSPRPAPAPGAGELREPQGCKSRPLPPPGPKSFFLADSQWRGRGYAGARMCVFRVTCSQVLPLTEPHDTRLRVAGWGGSPIPRGEAAKQGPKNAQVKWGDECQSHARRSTFLP